MDPNMLKLTPRREGEIVKYKYTYMLNYYDCVCVRERERERKKGGFRRRLR